MKNENTVIIVTGGQIDREILIDQIELCNSPYIIGVDRGIDTLHGCGIKPDMVLGDFDSIDGNISDIYKFREDAIVLPAMKDFTDTHVAVLKAIEKNPSQIIIVGGTGSRLDHVLANIGMLKLCVENGIEAYIVDSNNKITMIKKKFQLLLSEQFGKYISLIPYSDIVKGVTLSGFLYDVNDFELKKGESIGVSNELREEKGLITIREGFLLVMQTRD